MSSSEVFSDRYELVRHVARGGMAQVYMAKDLLLDRPVAIKVLFPELSSDPSFVERFRREAQAAANLSHANIVSIYDWGQGEHTYFIVMEYIDGQTLSALLRSGPLNALRAAAIGADVASALDFAHRRGVIHRDVKPGNVLIDRHNHVKVADFGIARALSNVSEGLTQTGAVMGTATYFSPEQAQGQPVDARSDVYSLGVVLYEMVAGRPPFSAESPVAIAYKHVREQPEPPSQVNPAVPPDFEAVVMAAMAKAPEERYQSAADLRDDLARFANGQPVFPPAAGTTIANRGLAPHYAPYDSAAEGETSVFDMMETAYEPTYDVPAGAVAPRSRAAWWAVLFVVLLGVLGVLVYFIGRNDNWWGKPTAAAVPALTGVPLKQAEAQLKARGFTSSPSVHYEESALVNHGDVVKVSPAAGKVTPFKNAIALWVSSGAPLVKVPALANLQCATADTVLKAYNLSYSNIPQNNMKVAANLVISTSPAAPSKAPEFSKVKVYCSLGPHKTEVPVLTGKTQAAAGAMLFKYHLDLGNVTQTPSPTVTPGDVAYTLPPAGAPEPWGTRVNLVVSSGPATVTVPPNLVGETQAQASNELVAAKLSPVIEPVPVTDPSKDGRVISTNPSPGKTDRRGAAVTLEIGQYTPATTVTPTLPGTTLSPSTTLSSPTTTLAEPTTTVAPTSSPSTSTTVPTSTSAAATTTTAPGAPPGAVPTTG